MIYDECVSRPFRALNALYFRIFQKLLNQLSKIAEPSYGYCNLKFSFKVPVK